VVANVLLYLPLGFFAACALEMPIFAALACATLGGFALSLFVEVFQFYAVGHVQSLADIGSNTSGALLGAAAGIWARRRLSSVSLGLLLACWLASRWYPVSSASSLPLLDLFRFFVAWLTVGWMLEALWGLNRSRFLLPLFLCVSLTVRAIAVNIEPAEILGGATAALLWCIVLWRRPERVRIAATLIVTLVVLLALAPFRFSAPTHAFGWIPFAGFLDAGRETAIRVFFEKVFFYGSMIALLVRAGFSYGAAAAFGGTLVFCLRMIQVYLPGRSAEITDATLVLMLAAMMKMVSLALKS
jgi:glycopeptide antibiotics resistance protein